MKDTKMINYGWDRRNQEARAGIQTSRKGKMMADGRTERWKTPQAWAARQAAKGKHSVFRERRNSKWVCICGELFADTKSEAEFHERNPHMTTYPEDWNPHD